MPFGFDPNAAGPPGQQGGNIFTQQPTPQDGEQDIFGARPQQEQEQPQFADTQQEGVLGFIQKTFGGPQKGFMALGATPKGEAYYGEGFGGWARKTFAKFFDPNARNEGIDYQRQDEIALEAQNSANQWAQKNPNLAGYKEYYGAIEQAKLLRKEQLDTGVTSGLGVAAGEAQALLKTTLVDVGIMGVLQLGDIGMRKLLAGSEGVDEILDTSSNITKWEPFQAQYDWMRENLPMGGNIADFAQNFNPIVNSWNTFRYAADQWEKGDYLQAGSAFGLGVVGVLNPALSATGVTKGIAGITEASPFAQKDQEAAIMARNLTGSNMIYTQMFDSLVKAEIQKELQAGVPPTFVEEAYVNPWVELVGSLALDPLNVVGSGTGKASKFLSGAQDITKVTPEVKNALGALADTSKAVNAAEIAKTARQVTETIAGKVKSLETLSGKYGATTLNSSGKQFVTSRTVGGFLRFMVGQHVGDVDEAANFVRKMAELAMTKGDDVAKQTELMTYFSKVKGGEQAFTEAGYATMAIFKNMLGEGGDVEKFAAGLMKATEGATTAAEKTEKMASKAAQIIDDATRKLFPSVDEIKKLDPEKYAKLPEYVKTLNSFLGRNSTIGSLYGKANGMFAGIYMGLSPAFAIRNALANTVSIVADQGIGAGLKGGAAQLENMFKPGALHQRNLDDLTKALGALPADIMSMDTLATEVGSQFGTLKWSNRAEAAGRAAIYRNAVVAEIERGIRTALPGMDTLKSAGFSEAQLNTLVDLVRKHRGQVGDAMKEFTEIVTKNGGVIPAYSLVQPSQKMRGFLQKLNLDGALDALRRTDFNSVDEFKKAADDILGNVRSVAAQSDNELARVAEGTREMDIIDGMLQNLKGPIGEALDKAFNHMGQTFQTARQAAYKSADSALSNVFDTARQAGDWNTAQMVDAARSKLGEVMREPLGETVASGISNHRNIVRALVEDVRAGKVTAEQAIGRLQITFPSGKVFNGAEMFDAADKFGDFVWQKYWPALSGEWWGDFNHMQYAQVSEQLAGLGLDAEKILEPTRALMAEGFRLQDGIVAAKGNAQNINAMLEGAEIALKSRGIDITQAAPEAVQAAKKAPKPFVKSADVMHSLPGAIREQVDNFADEFAKWQDNVVRNWGQGQPGKPLEQLDGTALQKWADEAEKRMVQVRRIATEVGQAQGDFALHAYKDKTYLDNALAFIYPYHYWYGRTYKNWAERLVMRPDVMSAYGKYRRTMEQLHAGMPDFWKYNLSTNDLPGVDMENPLYFNLEATLNPINGLTGTDFNDSKKRVDWLSRTVDDMGKFGPSMFSPISWLMAAKLYADGENDAANRWMGRLLPQSSAVKAAASLFGKNLEIDPFVNLFQGGLDPFERNRVGRALGAMVQEGMITEEQAIDAANQQKGDLWEAAALRATQARAPGQLAGFVGGVGFKARNPSDIEIDNFYNDYYMLMGASSNIPPDVYRQAMTELQKKYPFMDTVLISKKADDARMSAYAYNVIGRIPPGANTEMLKSAGLTQDMISRFYEGKGKFDGWTQTDVNRFMSGIGDLGTILALPNNATRQEWDAARNAYGNVSNQMKQQFGSDILDKIDLYYALPKEKKDIYLNQHPEITQAFNFKSQQYATDPILYKYYGGIENLNKYYKSQMYSALEQKYGADIQDKWDQYYALQLSNPSGAKAFYRSHPELAGYSKDKKVFQEQIMQAAARVAAKMPSGAEVPIREDFKVQSQYQQEILNAAQGVQGPQFSPEEWQAGLGDPLYRLMLDYWQSGKDLSNSAESQLGYQAKKMGFKNADEALQAFGITFFQGQQP